MSSLSCMGSLENTDSLEIARVHLKLHEFTKLHGSLENTDSLEVARGQLSRINLNLS